MSNFENSGPAKFRRGDLVRKVGGAAWQGRVVGEYSTDLTAEGYAVESEAHPGSVQIYPAKALELSRPLDIGVAVAEAALAEPRPDADGWIPWAGGECPVDEKALVEVKLRSGSAWIDQEAQMGADWLWDHDGGADDIIFYRVVKP